MKKIPIGEDNFKDLIEKNAYYVDKTEVIEELLYNETKVTLFPRPRRFGKSLLLSMIDCFFNVDEKQTNRELFKGLYIENSKYYKEFGKYPVIHVDFKELKQNTFEKLYDHFKILISELYIEKEYVKEVLKDAEIKTFDMYINREGNEADYEKSINLLSKWLNRYHKEKVIILIDEYDAPITNAYVNEIYEEVMNFLRSVYSSSLKGNESLKFGILTGITRVSKESIFSGFNNLKIYDIMNKQYNEYFGFTEIETKELVKYYDIEFTEEIKEYYDGYNFGGKEIYNPWSILNYVQDKTLVPYWSNTSDNALIKEILKETSEENKEEIEKLILGESISFDYDNTITFSDLKNKINSKNVIFNLLLSSGYLTFDKKIVNEISNFELDYFKIPNKEVREELKKIISEINSMELTKEEQSEFLMACLSNNKKQIEESLNQNLQSMSYYDTKEMFYHGYILGLFSIFIGNEYIIKSNRESGLGRYDLMIEKKDRSIGIIIEIKLASQREEMEELASKALNQIKTQEYYKELELDKVEMINTYSIVFYGKECIAR